MKKTAKNISDSQQKTDARFEPDTDLPTMGTRIRHYRERLGLSQDELALRVGAAQQTIQSLESGKIRKSTFLPQIAKALGVDFDTLLFGQRADEPVRALRPLLTATARRVPLFTTRDCAWVQAFLTDQAVQSPSGKWVSMDYSLPFAESGSRLFALKLGLSDETFQPEFRPGDQLLIDPDAPIQPSDPVVVLRPEAKRLSLFRYRVLSLSGESVDYELVAMHPDFPSISGAELQAVQILGPVIQMRRPISSRVRLAVLEEQSR
ncbi:helix-turn-helix domain-containing protein [Methylomonas rapida]|uniref:Helix-turn-helix domain-containing protein n=1 Tax=Methylomonas rapida TaxID=2963939 RepID=A0ABY7GF13_9GAMM|nr:XRE family transcriptional regulator [Methylomonas rapida]WAR43021.1 helix-turn-helix domain-containing protein [Methylomonas rapida]